MGAIQMLAKLWEILFPIAKEIISGIKSGDSDEEIADRVSGKVKLLKPELDALRNRKEDLNDFIQNG